MTEQTITEEIPQINLSDSKQLADFARYEQSYQGYPEGGEHQVPQTLPLSPLTVSKNIIVPFNMRYVTLFF